ncbi:hypothetical protein EJB05_01929, partial [Eragrostis curvula]
MCCWLCAELISAAASLLLLEQQGKGREEQQGCKEEKGRGKERFVEIFQIPTDLRFERFRCRESAGFSSSLIKASAMTNFCVM